MTVIIPGFEGNCRENALWENYSQKVSYRVPAILEPTSVSDIVHIIRAAESQRKKVRATGSGWSFEDICRSDDWMVDLGPQLHNKLDSITGVSDILHDRHVTRVASGPLRGARIPTGNIVHVEAGIKLLDLNRLLDTLQRALPTMGGSQGQQLAGAFSTSTHGSDFGHGPLADYVLAVHLVTSGGRQVWIESASRPVTSGDDALRRALPSADTLIIRDDEALNAVTVGLGRFGVIYSVILEVVPEHELLEWTSKHNVDEMMALLRAGAGHADPLPPLIGSMAAGPRPASVRDLRRKSHLKYIDITLSSRPADEGWVRRRWVRNGTLARPVMAENPNWPDPTAWAKLPKHEHACRKRWCCCWLADGNVSPGGTDRSGMGRKHSSQNN
jgi:FAD/FMN-containing dehydrogenase